MANFSEVVSAVTGVNNMLNNTIIENGVSNLSSIARGLVVDLFTISIGDMCDFNAKNYAYMTYHMLRNIHEKNITLDTIGEKAYPLGNPDMASMAPQKPSYTDGNNYYVDFMEPISTMESIGQLTTRINDNNDSSLFNVSNKYFDTNGDGVEFRDEDTPLLGFKTRNGNIVYSNQKSDRNSILYKMQRLYLQNKVNTIISDFHTKNGLKYTGQVATSFGESHGRNLLTKEAEENGSSTYSINGYDNPYCRVWTHHYMYDRLAKTMRAKTGGINYWGDAFEWGPNDKGHVEDKTKYGDGENYDYSWRGHHNQERRRRYSVLDFYDKGDTGLPIITPKFGDSTKKIHTKSCMFSIENLAWKDYDPYSFEQALSWEQRGPFGGRIMWFPPYNLKINENSNAKWSSNEFIGRGEPVYTYVSTERTGSLSFTMLTDHPSSIDYSTWWDKQDGDLGKGIDNVWGEGNKENDYLRYFAGCMSGDNNGEDNIIEKPTPMTDEYEQVPLIGMQGEEDYTEEIDEHREAIIPPDPVFETRPEKNEETVEFYVFYPNNYSGILDIPGNKSGKDNVNNGPKVDAILYLLAGRNAQKLNGYNDSELRFDSVTEDYLNNKAIGYEMSNGGITTNDYKSTGNYIQGGVYDYKWQKVDNKKWAYRVDHIQRDDGNGNSKYIGNKGTNGKFINEIDNVNTHNQGVWGDSLKDFSSRQMFNLKTDDYLKTTLGVGDNPNLYSFAEVAMAIYSGNLNNNQYIYDYLDNKLSGISGAIERVNKLIDLFDNMELSSIVCIGTSNQHGSDSSYNDTVSGSDNNKRTRRNVALAENRAKTVESWIKGVDKWKNVKSNIDRIDSDHNINDAGNSINSGESTPNAKIFRNAYCKLIFKTSSTSTSVNNNPDYSMSKDDNYEMLPFWLQDKEFDVNDVVQSEGNAYKALKSIKSTGTETWSGPELTDTQYWTSVDVKEFDSTVDYKENDYVLYNGYVYKALHDIQRGLDIHVDAQFNGYKGFREVGKPVGGNDEWKYYKKDRQSEYWQQKANESEPLQEKDANDIRLTTEQVLKLFEKEPFCGIKTKIIEDNPSYRGEFNELYAYPSSFFTESNLFKWIRYKKGDIVKYEDKYYKCTVDIECDDRFAYFDWKDIEWKRLKDEEDIRNNLKLGYFFINPSRKKFAKEKNLCLIGGEMLLCTKVLSEEEGCNKHPELVPTVRNSYWEALNSFSGTQNYRLNDIVVYGGEIYKLRKNDGITYTPRSQENKFKRLDWERQSFDNYSIFNEHTNGQFVKYNDVYYKCIKNCKAIEKQEWSDDITPAIEGIVKNECKNDYSYNGNYPYYKSIIIKDGDFYKSQVNFKDIDKDSDRIVRHNFRKGDVCVWEEVSDGEFFSVKFTKDDYTLQKRAAMTLCMSEEELRQKITKNGSYSPTPVVYNTESAQWGYLKDNIGDGFGSDIQQNTDLDDYIKNSIGSTINFTNDETKYLSLQLKQGNLEHDLPTTARYIALYRLFEMTTKVVKDGIETEACNTEIKPTEELIKKNLQEDDGSCDGDLWVDRGDGILIQLCSLNSDEYKHRFNVENMSGDWNKLRYDQEYFFYRRYFADHPFIFDKLQDKIKYFQPAFHSMTPEGFNARLTFLQQCTRQGNTKTMSDTGGQTANNLAFGRAPYCVLRLGDFYNQMIVIDSVSFDYSVSDGLQWDLNTEGNGVQPMLVNVSINFKFIGGGDITGPVQRLQNAMTFNYYANTSFYDNRADRVEYTYNEKTMGGAGNHEMNQEQSYGFKGKMYDAGNKERPIVMVNKNGTKISDSRVK